MENKINYHKEALKIIEGLKGRKPRLLAHVCCGPCSTYPLKFLHDHFDVTVIFHNSNIYPEREYVRRYQVLEEFVSRFNIDFSADVKIVKTAYENDEFNKHLAPFG
ncbi:MAG TPA: recombinase, partial [Firmicutes bacterium]|nr:recombinase [Bacillota bacterium]